MTLTIARCPSAAKCNSDGERAALSLVEAYAVVVCACQRLPRSGAMPMLVRDGVSGGWEAERGQASRLMTATREGGRGK